MKLIKTANANNYIYVFNLHSIRVVRINRNCWNYSIYSIYAKEMQTIWIHRKTLNKSSLIDCPTHVKCSKITKRWVIYQQNISLSAANTGIDIHRYRFGNRYSIDICSFKISTLLVLEATYILAYRILNKNDFICCTS